MKPKKRNGENFNFDSGAAKIIRKSVPNNKAVYWELKEMVSEDMGLMVAIKRHIPFWY